MILCVKIILQLLNFSIAYFGLKKYQVQKKSLLLETFFMKLIQQTMNLLIFQFLS